MNRFIQYAYCLHCIRYLLIIINSKMKNISARFHLIFIPVATSEVAYRLRNDLLQKLVAGG